MEQLVLPVQMEQPDQQVQHQLYLDQLELLVQQVLPDPLVLQEQLVQLVQLVLPDLLVLPE